MDEKVKIIADFWNGYAGKFDEEHATENIDQWRTVLGELMDHAASAKILDIGTGTGFLALMMAELGYQSYGVDIAEDMMEIGRQHAKERGVTVEFLFGEGEHLPFADNSFDAVINSRVIWTLVDPQQSFAEWKRVLKPGGKAMSFIRISDTPESNPFTCYSEEFDRQLPLKNAPKEVMAAEMEKAGYRNGKAIRLPQAITQPDLSPWYVIYGEK